MSDSSDFIPRYTKEEVIRRFVYLEELLADYLTYFRRVRPSWDLRCDHLVLLNVAQSAMDDIWRFKAYHLGNRQKRSDAVKRAAYFTKWIVRHRPIYFKRIISEMDPLQNLDKTDTTLLINEQFSIFVSLNTLSTALSIERIELDPDFSAKFLYDLHYRNIPDDALLSIYEIIKEAVQDKSVILKVTR